MRVALVGGPMYDALYDTIPRFTLETRIGVEVVVRLPHPELNSWVTRSFESGDPDVDLLSTHSKYAPSQAQWLSPLDGIVRQEDLDDLLPRPMELSRIDGRLMQVPRNLDVRLLHYRTDLIGDAAKPDAPAIPATWSSLADAATRLTHDSFYGFLFPGRESGLFGTFYELLVGAGGHLFDDALKPAFDSAEGLWALEFLVELHNVRRVTPRALTEWHYDEISAAFRSGHAAMVSDWPGSYHLYSGPDRCDVWDRVGLAPLPAGPAGIRAAYSGCHSFAIPRTARNPEGAVALLRHFMSIESQLGEARRGAIPCRASALTQVRDEASSDAAAAFRWSLLADAEQTMIVPPRFAEYPRCEDVIWRAVQQAMLGACSPAQALSRAADDVRSIVHARAGAA